MSFDNLEKGLNIRTDGLSLVLFLSLKGVY